MRTVDAVFGLIGCLIHLRRTYLEQIRFFALQGYHGRDNGLLIWLRCWYRDEMIACGLDQGREIPTRDGARCLHL